MRRLLLCTIALATFCACQVRGDLAGQFACVDDPTCPDGFVCEQGVCKNSEGPDGGPVQEGPCATSDQLGTTFDGAALPTWSEQPYLRGDGTVAVAGGELVMNIPANRSEARAQISSYAHHDMRGKAITFEVPAVGGVTTEAGLLDPSGAEVYWGMTEGDMFVYSKGRMLKRRSYSATNDRWWRVREEGQTMIWETSPDGAAWTLFASDSAPIDTAWVRLELSLQGGNMTPAATARWASISAGVDSTVKWCSLAGYQESLTDNDLAPSAGYYGNNCTAVEQDGKLLVTGAEHDVSCVVYTNRPLDVRGAAVAMEIGASAYPGGTRISFGDFASRHYLSMEAKDKLYFYIEAEDNRVFDASSPRDDASQKYWRVAFSGAQIRFDVSADAVTWTTLQQTTVPTFDASAMYFERGMYIEPAGPLPVTSTFGALLR